MERVCEPVGVSTQDNRELCTMQEEEIVDAINDRCRRTCSCWTLLQPNDEKMLQLSTNAEIYLFHNFETIPDHVAKHLVYRDVAAEIRKCLQEISARLGQGLLYTARTREETKLHKRL